MMRIDETPASDTYGDIAERILNKVVTTKSALRVMGKEIEGRLKVTSGAHTSPRNTDSHIKM